MKRINELTKTQDELIMDNPGFPVKKCSLTAKVLFQKFGFLPFSGLVFTPNGLEEHSWNMDEFGKIIDLTYYGFDSSASKIIYADFDEVSQDKGYFIDEEKTKLLREYISLEKINYARFNSSKFF